MKETRLVLYLENHSFEKHQEKLEELRIHYQSNHIYNCL